MLTFQLLVPPQSEQIERSFHRLVDEYGLAPDPFNRCPSLPIPEDHVRKFLEEMPDEPFSLLSGRYRFITLNIDPRFVGVRKRLENVRTAIIDRSEDIPLWSEGKRVWHAISGMHARFHQLAIMPLDLEHQRLLRVGPR